MTVRLQVEHWHLAVGMPCSKNQPCAFKAQHHPKCIKWEGCRQLGLGFETGGSNVAFVTANRFPSHNGATMPQINQPPALSTFLTSFRPPTSQRLFVFPKVKRCPLWPKVFPVLFLLQSTISTLLHRCQCILIDYDALNTL